MHTSEIISKIKSANRLSDILDVNKFKQEYDKFIKQIHPDVCSDPEATEATAKLNKLKSEFEEGSKLIDDAGSFTTDGYTVVFEGEASALKRSVDNFNCLKSLKDAASLNFQKYLPIKMEYGDGKVSVILSGRAVPLSGLSLPQEHVNWILSRMIEFSAWLSQVGYTHCGINPESVFIVPETHGLQVCSFYHMAPVDARVATISGKYQSWYPPSLFSDKKATGLIDLELSKKTAIYLLGDKSGSGIKLKKTHHEKFIDFVISQHDDTHSAYSLYRKLLNDNFEKKFYPLNL